MKKTPQKPTRQQIMKAASQDFTVFEDEIPCCSVSYKPIYKAGSMRGICPVQTAVLPAG